MERARSTIWLLAGGVLMVFSVGKWTVPLAIWLLMGMATFDLGAARLVHDHAVLIEPAGQIVYSYT